jgi:hypothetical protein
MFTKSTRRAAGQSIVVLGLFISVFVLLALGLFSFELNRMELAKEQLRAACDAASLSAAASLASSDNLDPTTAQTTAIDTALTTFQQNIIVGNSMANAALAAAQGETPLANQALLYFEFLDPHNNDQPVSLGDPNGKIIRVDGSFGLVPAFGRFLGLSTIPIKVSSSGGVPAMDVALCFDVSASIDDQTPVTFVRRQWNPAKGKIDYIIPPTQAGSPAGPLAQGRIFDIIGPPAIGSSVDGVYPQNLSDTNTAGKNQYPLNFSEASGRTGAAPGLRGKTNSGSPPGNCPPGAAGTGNQYTFTDLVVNIDGKMQFAGIVSNGYNFPDVATLIEAARGNLENNAVFLSSKANTGVPANIQPKAGYQAAYFQMAQANLHPLGDAQVAAQQFLTIMNTNTDAHFCLTCFTSNAGTSPTSTYGADNVDGYYTAAGTSNFPVPLIPLNSGSGNSNFSQAYSVLPNTVAISGTNIGDAINTAVNQLSKNSRAGSKKAIVLFTDGEPTSAGPLDSDPWTNARKAAVLAQKAGIPVYCIGLAQNQAIIPSETGILNDTDPNPSTGGIAAIAGHGGKFFLVTNVQDLRLTFENIARQLVQLVQ